MNKLLSFIGAAALVLLASCSSDEPATTVTGTDGVVSFKVTMPGNLSRAINDGYKAVDVTYAVYDADNGNDFLFQGEKTAAFDGNSLETTIDIQLVNGKSYMVAFFAKNSAAPYTIADGVLTVDYATAGTANLDTYDAFYGCADVVKVEAGMAQPSATLTRPFAQVNVGAADYDAAVKAGFEVQQTGMTFSAQVPTTMDMKDGSVSGTAEVTYNVAALPEDATITVAGKAYSWVAMNYVLASKDDATINQVNFNYVAPDGSTVAVPVNSVPVKRNYRTNIVGNFFTSSVTYDIVIDPAFTTPDEVVPYKSVTTANDLLAAVAAGTPVRVEKGTSIDLGTEQIEVTGTAIVRVDGELTTTNDNVFCVNGADAYLELDGEGTLTGNTKRGIRFEDGGSGSISNVTISCMQNHFSGAAISGSNAGTVKIENVSIESSYYSISFWGGDVTIKNCNINCIASHKYGTGSYAYALDFLYGDDNKVVIEGGYYHGVQGVLSVGDGYEATVLGGTFIAENSDAQHNDAYYALYVHTAGVASVYDGNFYSPRYAVYSGNNDNTGYPYGIIYLYGGLYNTHAYSQETKSDYPLPTGYTWLETGDATYPYQVVKE